ncbi:ImmA/IrrE family metallo-endopeptidase [uncultured Parolsenella sp.]|uniref:ImmA/IrrE family metallo-endopeptidase n=1 Tax=uncultured Parolsenella sp. TaxID=2083008 RepID=UPI0025D623B9|nr:ImmA/IrrE family metallo-endopeptidase [uncultured Parolsenella sp.]
MKKIDLADTHDYGVEVPPKSRRRLTLDAHLVHTAIEYRGDRSFPVIEFLECGLPLLFSDFEFEVLTKEEMGKKFGETYPDRHLVRLREDVYDGAVAGDPFSRMTAAHEIGPLFEHEGIPLALMRKEASRSVPAYKSSEWQANAFAGALLMPACKIVGLTAEEVSERYEVTITAAYTQRNAMLKEAKKWNLPLL